MVLEDGWVMGEGWRSGGGSGDDGAGGSSARSTRLYVGLFQLLVAAIAFYVGAIDSRPLDFVAGAITAALGFRSFVLYRRGRSQRRPEENGAARSLTER